MRICFVFLPIEPYSPRHAGAFSTTTAAITQELEALGHCVTIVAAQQDLPAYEAGTVVDATIAPRKTRLQRRVIASLGSRKGYDWHDHARYLRRVADVLGELDPSPDVIVVGNDVQVGLRLFNTVRRPYVLWQMNELVTRHHDIRMASAVYKGAVVISDFIGAQVARVTGLPTSCVLTVPGGVDLNTFRPRQDWATAPAHREVLLLGRLDPNKGYHLVLDSLQRLRQNGHSFRVSLAVAPSHFGADQTSYAAMLGNQLSGLDGIALGHLDRGQLPSRLRQADITCALSQAPEPFGLVVLEAMASGVAVVASRIGGLPEAAGDAGLLIDPGDSGELDTALAELLSSDLALIEAKRAGLARARSASWSLVAASFLSALQTLLADHGPPEAVPDMSR
jgi:glycosyltransferase involved in cell wall biosynthesis